MEKADEALKKAERSLERYRKNKTMVHPEELEGKYKKPFEKLKKQLKEELEEYLRFFVLDGLQIRNDEEGRQVIAEINLAFKEMKIGKRVRRAAFKDFDLGKIMMIAQEYRQIVELIYKAYFDRHTCLYVPACSWDPDNPKPPLIYNDIVDKFWDDETNKWLDRERPPGDAILIFIENIREVQRND